MKITEFAKQVTNCTVSQKQQSYNKIQAAVKNEIGPDGSKMDDSTKRELKALLSWLGMNIMVGEELCPADTVTNYYDKYPHIK